MLKTAVQIHYQPIAGRVVVPPDFAFVPVRLERTGASHKASVCALRTLTDSLPALEISSVHSWETSVGGTRIFASPRNHHSRCTGAVRIPLSGLDLWARAERVAETLDALWALDLEQSAPVFALEDSSEAQALAAAQLRERADRLAQALGLPVAQIHLNPEPKIQILGPNMAIVEVTGQIALGQPSATALQWAS